MQCEYQVSSAMHSTVHVCDTLMFASAMQDLPPNFAVDQKMSWDHFINFGQWEARPFRFSCGEHISDLLPISLEHAKSLTS